MIGEFTTDRESEDRTRRSLSRPTEIAGKGIYYLLFTISITILLAPIIIVVGIAFNPTTREAFPPTGISLRWFEAFLESSQFFPAFVYVSLPIAIITGIVSTLLGVMAAYVIVRREVPYENMIQSMLLGPLIIPAVIIGFGMMLFLARINLDLPIIDIVIGHTIITLPYTLLTAMTRLYDIDPEIEEAARNLGATKFDTFRKVTLPLMRSGVIAGFLFAFIISFADINIVLFLAGDDVTTLPLSIFLFLRWESSPIIAAISTVQILLIMVVVILIGRLVGFEAFTSS
jgi:putative spermidine/putrescine transport system permease protein